MLHYVNLSAQDGQKLLIEILKVDFKGGLNSHWCS